ncbi:MAG: flavodoxin family protein [Sumerlaeia bacterium]
MAKIAIVYHSGYGHTAAVAERVLKGAQSVPGVEARLIKATEAADHWDFLDEADAHIYGSPTYMGDIASELKKFFEETSRRWMERKWVGKLASGFTNSGGLHGDKLHSLTSMLILAAQHGMIWVPLKHLATGTGPDDINRIGAYLGPMAQSDHGKSAEQGAPPEGDRRTAEMHGADVARAALQWIAGKSVAKA